MLVEIVLGVVVSGSQEEEARPPTGRCSSRDTKVFRTEGWTMALIVSEDIKQALERMKATGVKFKQV